MDKSIILKRDIDMIVKIQWGKFLPPIIKHGFFHFVKLDESIIKERDKDI